MKRLMLKNSKNIYSKLLIVFILSMLFLSFFYFCIEAHHDCDGDDCPICECLARCETVFKTIALTTISKTFITFVVNYFLIIIFFFKRFYLKETLISNKVRFND